MFHNSLGQLHRATPSCPRAFVWGKTNEPDCPARGRKWTFVCFLSAFDPSPVQVCVAFGVKRIARGRAGHLRVSSPGPPVGGTGTPFSIRPLPPSGRTHSLFPSPPPLPLQPCSSDTCSPSPFPSVPSSYQPRPPSLHTRRPDLGRIWSVLSSPAMGGRAAP